MQAEQARHVNTKWLRKLSDLPLSLRCKLHFESDQSQNSLLKALYITYSLLRLDTHRCLLWGRGCLKLSSSQQIAHYSTQNDSLLPLFVTDVVLVIKTCFRNQTHKKRTVSRIFITLLTRKIPRMFPSNSKNKLKNSTVWWSWPLTSYCDVTKTYFSGALRVEREILSMFLG